MSRKRRNQKHGAGDAAGTPGTPNARISRRTWIGIAVGGVGAGFVGERWWRSSRRTSVAGATAPVTVYASPSCGCCHNWVDHLVANGFRVNEERVYDVTPAKRRLGVPDSLWSCHTGVVQGYVVEGHVPADLIQRMLEERPAIAGLAVPGMPNGSPGMEGLTKDRYDVVSFTRSGDTAVYATR